MRLNTTGTNHILKLNSSKVAIVYFSGNQKEWPEDDTSKMYFAQLTQGTRARETKPNVENMKTKKI